MTPKTNRILVLIFTSMQTSLLKVRHVKIFQCFFERILNLFIILLSVLFLALGRQ